MQTNNLPEKKKIMLKPEHILRFFISEDPQMDNLLIFHSDTYDIFTTDANLYYAMGSIKDYDNFKRNKLVKLLEVTKVVQVPKMLLTHEKVEHLRMLALSNTQNMQQNTAQQNTPQNTTTQNINSQQNNITQHTNQEKNVEQKSEKNTTQEKTNHMKSLEKNKYSNQNKKK